MEGENVQAVKFYKSIDELVEHFSQTVKNINWSYWKQNFIAFSSYWENEGVVYKIYSKDGLVLVVKVYDNGGFSWYIETMFNCYCE